uniref:SCP domain-containing protein n=1 Tax=Chenopodium quinoa TaxID=63459 RepID=A0A803M9F8_CHEQI
MRLFQLSISLLYTATFLFKSNLCIDENDKKSILDGHNAARAQVGVAPVSWDNKIEAYIQDFVDKVKSDCIVKDDVKSPYGMNIASGYEASIGWVVIGEWVNEKNKYNYTSNSCVKGKECAHYTQLVWRNSVRVGCANVACGAGWPFYACAYDPPGNIEGQRPY